MVMPGRSLTADGYRYGFNGKEKDKDLHSLTAYDYGFRIYNPGIGKFLSVDPLREKYPELTPYQFAGNMPTWAIDLDGLEPAWNGFQAGDNLQRKWSASEISSYRKLNDFTGEKGGKTLAKVVSNSLYFVPYVNIAKIAYELADGRDIVTKERLTLFQRVLPVVVPPLVRAASNEIRATTVIGSELTTGSHVVESSSGSISGAISSTTRTTTSSGVNSSVTFTQNTGNVSASLVTKYPANAALAGTTESTFLMPGQVIDRYGPLGGKWFSTPGTSYGARSIPPGLTPYMQFKVIKPFEVQKSFASPGMFSGQTGFGIQFQSPVSADILIKRGIITPL